MNILLTCNAGMSTSLLAEMMMQANKKLEENNKVWCIDIEKVEDEIEKCDVLLMAPQVRHALKRMKQSYGDRVPVGMIRSEDYGRLDGMSTLQYAKQLYLNYS